MSRYLIVANPDNSYRETDTYVENYDGTALMLTQLARHAKVYDRAEAVRVRDALRKKTGRHVYTQAEEHWPDELVATRTGARKEGA